MFALVTQYVPVLLSLLVFDLHGTFVSMFIVSTFLFWCESQLIAVTHHFTSEVFRHYVVLTFDVFV